MGDLTIFEIPISLGTMIYQAFLFTVLFVLLRKFVVKKLVKVLVTRKETIENQLAVAKNYQIEGESFAMEQKQLLEQAKVEARELISKGQKEAQNIINMAKEEAGMIRAQAYNEIINNNRKRDVG